ncbi:hypothetical protein [Arthrobacter sp. U41]|uniref:hypothetical protein n=1 Tax=Arthrobacter sp. U41 TaxID=1849032 RepID=UPI0021B4EC0D|nr:hypothetical protein [Arthrobacter sp. U41]
MSADVDGVSGTPPVPDDLATIEVPAGAWTAFRTEGEYPAALHLGRNRVRLIFSSNGSSFRARSMPANYWGMTKSP